MPYFYLNLQATGKLLAVSEGKHIYCKHRPSYVSYLAWLACANASADLIIASKNTINNDRISLQQPSWTAYTVGHISHRKP